MPCRSNARSKRWKRVNRRARTTPPPPSRGWKKTSRAWNRAQPIRHLTDGCRVSNARSATWPDASLVKRLRRKLLKKGSRNSPSVSRRSKQRSVKRSRNCARRSPRRPNRLSNRPIRSATPCRLPAKPRRSRPRQLHSPIRGRRSRRFQNSTRRRPSPNPFSRRLSSTRTLRRPRPLMTRPRDSAANINSPPVRVSAQTPSRRRRRPSTPISTPRAAPRVPLRRPRLSEARRWVVSPGVVQALPQKRGKNRHAPVRC